MGSSFFAAPASVRLPDRAAHIAALRARIVLRFLFGLRQLLRVQALDLPRAARAFPASLTTALRACFALREEHTGRPRAIVASGILCCMGTIVYCRGWKCYQ